MTTEAINLASLRRMFRPRSVAIIGASSDPMKIGGRPVSFLKDSGYCGEIYPVNPNATEIQGLPAFGSVTDIAGNVDLAICAVPGRLVEQTLRECAQKGVTSVVVFSAGFAEIGDEGSAAQERLSEIARESGMRLMGPNCMGIANFADGMIASFHPAYASRPDTRMKARIGLVSQSGAFGGLSCTMANNRGIPFRYVLTTGNEADVEASDCLAFLADDPETDVIMLYLEGCRNGPKLLSALELARRNNKKVVALKLGRTEAGAEAAASHTAALAGSDAVYDAVFRQFGVYRAGNIEEFFDVGCAAAIGPLPDNNSVGLITVSGGVGVLMADDAVSRGLDVTPLPAKTQAKIKEMVPFAGVRNPLDVTGQVLNDPTLFGRALRLVLDEADYGSLVCFLGASGTLPRHREAISQMWRDIRARYPDKLIAAAGIFPDNAVQEIEELGIPFSQEPTNATRAVAALSEFARLTSRPWNRPVVSEAATKLPVGPLNEIEAMDILGKAGVPVVAARLATSASEAAAAFADMDGPVVMKIVSRDLMHKSEFGGVRLNVSSSNAAAQSYDDIIAAVRTAAPDARLDGCLLAPMVTGGVETILGVTCDPVFGPVVMFGLGGVFVEVLQDVTFRVAPFDVDEAQAMIREINGFPLLQGVRGQPAADIDALAEALCKLSHFAAAHRSQIDSFEANPFLVLAKGKGALALDAVLITQEMEN